MKTIRITWNGQLLREVYPHATKWQVFKYKMRRFFHRVLIVTAISMFLSGLTYTAFALGAEVTKPNIVQVVADYTVPPVLQRIAKCESGNSQTDSHGQVLLHWNKNGTVDIGQYAINQIWEAQASKLNLNLAEAKDNLAMAMWLYQNKGTEPWYPSKDCWSK